MSNSLLAILIISSYLKVESTNINFKNKCSSKITIYETSDGVVAQPIATISRGGSYNGYSIPWGFSGRFTTTTDPEATLFECSLTDSDSEAWRKFWYNLSIIPPGSYGCYSWEDCVKQTGNVGFNVAMHVQPDDTSGNNCEALSCPSDGCSDAYGYPTDDWKVKVCDPDVDITLTLCSGSAFTYEEDTEGTSMNTIIAILVITVLLCCIVIGGGVYYCMRRRKEKLEVSFEDNKDGDKLEEDGGDKGGYDMNTIDTTSRVSVNI